MLSKAAPISKIRLKENCFTQFDDKQNANTFKNFHSKLASDLVEKLPTARNIFRENFITKYYSTMNIPSNSFKFKNAKILINIEPNRAYGIDEFPGRFLRDEAELLTEPLCKIINLSLSSKFPLICKTAKVKPLYKKGKNTEPENYRPVSLLPILSKITERVVYNQLIEHLEKHDILYEYQSGFRSKHSVNTCLAHLSNQILIGFESGKSTGIILIDLQKAFDTLDHDILLDKMKYFGFTSKTIDWFGSYLKKRNIVVSLEKTLSETGILNRGVPQGSLLGPMLFLLYVNDMKTALKNCDLRLYANDTCILYSHQNIKFIERNLNYDFNNSVDGS